MGLSPQAGAGAPSLGAAERGREQTEEETKRAVEAFFGTGGLSSLYPAKNKSAKPEYVGRRKDPDLPNRYVAEVEQRVDGVPVFGSTAKLNVDTSLGVTKFSGTISTVALDDTKPRIAEGEAIAAARAKLADVLRSTPDASRAFPLAPNPDKAEVAKPDLVVFDPALIGKAKNGQTRLAWLVTIDSFRIFVDAITGEAFYSYRDQPSGGMLRRIFDLAQTTTFPGSVGIDEEKRAALLNIGLPSASRRLGSARLRSGAVTEKPGEASPISQLPPAPRASISISAPKMSASDSFTAPGSLR
jgi:hypothetical protein